MLLELKRAGSPKCPQPALPGFNLTERDVQFLTFDILEEWFIGCSTRAFGVE